jgi:phage terminase large subunit GpA-like protein
MNPTYDYARDYWHDRFKTRVPTRTHNPSIVEYAEKTIVSTGVYRGTKFSHTRAPYLKRPMWCLSPASPYREISMMFPAQSGKTFTADTVAMYYIEAVPSEILYATSDETMAVKWLEREIVPRANSAGIIFKSEVEAKQSRRTGNTSYSKTFPGGVIDIASALSPSQLASATKRIVLGDEVDRWKITLGEQGSVINQLRARTQAWDSQAKIFWFSTPTTEDASVIFQLYQQGSQELYHVPCPYCGTMQIMDFEQGRGFGLTWERKGGHVYKKSIQLICEKCGKGIKESSKPRMLSGGEWRPSAIPEYDHMVSFNINGLYSFQLSWFDMVVAFEEAKNDPIKKQDFDQLKMGRPHRQTGTRPKAGNLVENRGTYKSKTVPDGVLYLTAGVDVQRGSDNDPNNPPRLELEVLGTGAGYRTASIEYRRFEGSVRDPYGGAWEKFAEYLRETGFTYHRNDGLAFPVWLMFIDSGDGDNTDIVYRFCTRFQSAFPSKGFSAIKRRKSEKGDEITEGNFRRYRAAKVSEDITLYEISTNYYKTQIYHNLKIARLPVDPQRPGFCDFPANYSERYFEMLTAEERRRDGSFHNPTGRRNEALDCRVMAMCAADVFLDSEVLTKKGLAKSAQMRPDQIQLITHRSVLDDMVKSTARRMIKPKA